MSHDLAPARPSAAPAATVTPSATADRPPLVLAAGPEGLAGGPGAGPGNAALRQYYEGRQHYEDPAERYRCVDEPVLDPVTAAELQAAVQEIATRLELHLMEAEDRIASGEMMPPAVGRAIDQHRDDSGAPIPEDAKPGVVAAVGFAAAGALLDAVKYQRYYEQNGMHQRAAWGKALFMMPESVVGYFAFDLVLSNQFVEQNEFLNTLVKSAVNAAGEVVINRGHNAFVTAAGHGKGAGPAGDYREGLNVLLPRIVNFPIIAALSAARHHFGMRAENPWLEQVLAGITIGLGDSMGFLAATALNRGTYPAPGGTVPPPPDAEDTAGAGRFMRHVDHLMKAAPRRFLRGAAQLLRNEKAVMLKYVGTASLVAATQKIAGFALEKYATEHQATPEQRQAANYNSEVLKGELASMVVEVSALQQLIESTPTYVPTMPGMPRFPGGHWSYQPVYVNVGPELDAVREMVAKKYDEPIKELTSRIADRLDKMAAAAEYQVAHAGEHDTPVPAPDFIILPGL